MTDPKLRKLWWWSLALGSVGSFSLAVLQDGLGEQLLGGLFVGFVILGCLGIGWAAGLTAGQRKPKDERAESPEDSK